LLKWFFAAGVDLRADNSRVSANHIPHTGQKAFLEGSPEDSSRATQTFLWALFIPVTFSSVDLHVFIPFREMLPPKGQTNNLIDLEVETTPWLF
jgi:hypothetical protein